MASLFGNRSTPMSMLAPLSLAPAIAHRPIGPCANTATLSPMTIADIKGVGSRLTEEALSDPAGHSTGKRAVMGEGSADHRRQRRCRDRHWRDRGGGERGSRR